MENCINDSAHCWHFYIGQSSYVLEARKWCCFCGEDTLEHEQQPHGTFKPKYPINT
jgi:hypothetical protein